MKRLAIGLALCLAASHAVAATITKNELIGSWVTAKPLGPSAVLATWLFDPPKGRLEVGEDLSVRFTRYFDGGKERTFLAPPSSVTFSEDLLIARFKGESGCECKLVLSGWVTKSNKRLFGELYLYGAEGLFNGLSISFEPEHGS